MKKDGTLPPRRGPTRKLSLHILMKNANSAMLRTHVLRRSWTSTSRRFGYAAFAGMPSPGRKALRSSTPGFRGRRSPSAFPGTHHRSQKQSSHGKSAPLFSARGSGDSFETRLSFPPPEWVTTCGPSSTVKKKPVGCSEGINCSSNLEQSFF